MKTNHRNPDLNHNCSTCSRAISNKLVISIVVWIITVLLASSVLHKMSPQYYASGNLLQFPSYSYTTRRSIYAHQSRALLPPNPNPSSPRQRQRPSFSLSASPSLILDEFKEYQFYLDFLVSYSVYKRWEVAQLLFSRNEPNVCHFFRINLLKEASVQATCHHPMMNSDSNGNSISDTVKSTRANPSNSNQRDLWESLIQNKNINNNYYSPVPLKLTDTDWTWRKDRPIVAFYFLPKFANKDRNSKTSRNDGGDRVEVNPRVLINYEPGMNVLVIAPSQESTGNIIEEIQPEINTNYKWTLASRVNETHMTVEDIYGLSTSSLPIRNDFGVWSQSSGLSIDHHKQIGPTNFEGRTIRVTTVEGPPVVYVDRTRRDGVIKGHGYLPDVLLDTVFSTLNITYVLTTPPDNGFGSVDENGNWSGMVGMLQRKEVEVALMSFSYTTGRKAVMDFSPPSDFSSARLLIRKDWKKNELKWKAYSDPFDWKVWLAIPLIVCTGVFTFFVFTHFKLMMTTPVQSAWMLSACFLQQGLDEHSAIRNFPCRLAMGSFWVLAVVLYASYTARLTSFLAASSDTLPINSLAEAVDNRNWKIGLVKGSSIPDRVKDSPVPEMVKMWKRVQADQSGYVSGSTEGINRVYKERFVFFTYELIPSFLVKGNCSYTWVPGKFFSGFGYMGYQKNLPYGASMSHQMSKIRESGQMKRLMRKWWGAEASCSVASAGGEVVGMSLYETGTAFLVLICGATLAITFLLLEFGLYLKKSIHEEKTIDEQSIPSYSASTFSSRASIQNTGLKGANNTHSNSINKNHQLFDVRQEKSSNLNGIFLRLATPFYYLLGSEKTTSMSTKWANSNSTGGPIAMHF